jgi:hypothetical protein
VISTDQQPARVRLPNCPAWCRGDHDPGSPDRTHYAPKPAPIRLSAEQPDPMCPFRTIAARRRKTGGLEQITLVIDGMYDHVLLTRSEARKLRDQISAALNNHDTTEVGR